MSRSMLPILTLITVALSSSDVLPFLPNKDNVDPFNVDDQSNDNIFFNNYDRNNLPAIFFYNNRAPRQSFVPIRNSKEKSEVMNADHENNGDENYSNSVNRKDDSYDDKGYRKEQWHNYPRQLDRLHNSQPAQEAANDPEIHEHRYEIPIDGHLDDYTANEFKVQSNDGDQNNYESIIAATNPYLVLKVQLTYLRDDVDRKNSKIYPMFPLESDNEDDGNSQDNNISFLNDIESGGNFAKVKREEPINNGDNEINDEDPFILETGESAGKKKSIKKRIFSLWSRLQSLSHRGHELHHRRHMHAFYGLPDNKGNGIVTAQTRAGFIRPPGSPLRWG